MRRSSRTYGEGERGEVGVGGAGGEQMGEGVESYGFW